MRCFYAYAAFVCATRTARVLGSGSFCGSVGFCPSPITCCTHRTPFVREGVLRYLSLLGSDKHQQWTKSILGTTARSALHFAHLVTRPIRPRIAAGSVAGAVVTISTHCCFAGTLLKAFVLVEVHRNHRIVGAKLNNSHGGAEDSCDSWLREAMELLSHKLLAQ